MRIFYISIKYFSLNTFTSPVGINVPFSHPAFIFSLLEIYWEISPRRNRCRFWVTWHKCECSSYCKRFMKSIVSKIIIEGQSYFSEAVSQLAAFSIADPGEPRGPCPSPSPVEISHNKMAAKGGHIDFMFLAPPPRPLDPMLVFSIGNLNLNWEKLTCIHRTTKYHSCVPPPPKRLGQKTK